MPRRSGHSSEESPAPRRTSARIAAVQAASPAKSPAKSPRRKRQSTDVPKLAADDTESQQSQVKSECSAEELNGLETNSSKDQESAADSQELSPKKAKLDNDIEDKEPEANDEATELPKEDTTATTKEEVSEQAADFEVVEKSEIPAPDSVEVNAAVSAQGEDGQLLVGFVQVDKEELPPATSLEINEVATFGEHQTDVTGTPDTESVPDAPLPCSVNGDVLNHSVHPEEPMTVDESSEINVQSKIYPISEITTPNSTPAAGDGTVDGTEFVSQ